MKRTKWTKYDVISVALYEHTNMSMPEIAQFLEMPYYTLVKRLRKLGVKGNRSKSLKGRAKSETHKKQLSINRIKNGTSRGKNNSNWRGGIQRKSAHGRSWSQYNAWRCLVYGRDEHICRGCGYSEGRILEAHHILPVEHFPENIFDVDNGITLCKKCHRLVHSVRKYKEGELSGSLKPLRVKVISSRAEAGMPRKVQRLGAESRTDSNASKSALHSSMKSDDIVRSYVKA